MTWEGRVCWGAVLVQPDHDVIKEVTPVGICWTQECQETLSCFSRDTRTPRLNNFCYIVWECSVYLLGFFLLIWGVFWTFLSGKWSKICQSLSELVTGRKSFIEIKRKIITCSLFSCVKWNLWDHLEECLKKESCGQAAIHLCMQCISNLLSTEAFPLLSFPRQKTRLRFVKFRWLVHSLTGICLFIVADSVLLVFPVVPQ